jgi:hypothetical protein
MTNPHCGEARAAAGLPPPSPPRLEGLSAAARQRRKQRARGRVLDTHPARPRLVRSCRTLPGGCLPTSQAHAQHVPDADSCHEDPREPRVDRLIHRCCDQNPGHRREIGEELRRLERQPSSRRSRPDERTRRTRSSRSRSRSPTADVDTSTSFQVVTGQALATRCAQSRDARAAAWPLSGAEIRVSPGPNPRRRDRSETVPARSAGYFRTEVTMQQLFALHHRCILQRDNRWARGKGQRGVCGEACVLLHECGEDRWPSISATRSITCTTTLSGIAHRTR